MEGLRTRGGPYKPRLLPLLSGGKNRILSIFQNMVEIRKCERSSAGLRIHAIFTGRKHKLKECFGPKNGERFGTYYIFTGNVSTLLHFYLKC